MSDKEKVNIKFIVLNGLCNFAINIFFHLRSFRVSNIQYKTQNCVVKRIASACLTT
jgi:hypothetical protein